MNNSEKMLILALTVSTTNTTVGLKIKILESLLPFTQLRRELLFFSKGRKCQRILRSVFRFGFLQCPRMRRLKSTKKDSWGNKDYFNEPEELYY